MVKKFSSDGTWWNAEGQAPSAESQAPSAKRATAPNSVEVTLLIY